MRCLCEVLIASSSHISTDQKCWMCRQMKYKARLYGYKTKISLKTFCFLNVRYFFPWFVLCICIYQSNTSFGIDWNSHFFNATEFRSVISLTTILNYFPEWCTSGYLLWSGAVFIRSRIGTYDDEWSTLTHSKFTFVDGLFDSNLWLKFNLKIFECVGIQLALKISCQIKWSLKLCKFWTIFFV